MTFRVDMTLRPAQYAHFATTRPVQRLQYSSHAHRSPEGAVQARRTGESRPICSRSQPEYAIFRPARRRLLQSRHAPPPRHYGRGDAVKVARAASLSLGCAGPCAFPVLPQALGQWGQRAPVTIARAFRRAPGRIAGNHGEGRAGTTDRPRRHRGRRGQGRRQGPAAGPSLESAVLRRSRHADRRRRHLVLSQDARSAGRRW